MAKRHPVPATATRVSMEPVAATKGWRPDLEPPVEPSGSVGEKVKVVSWGSNNLLPQDAQRIVYDSGAAESCITRRAQFIGGKGFASEVTASTLANPTQTLNDLLGEAKWDAAFEFGVAIVIRYTFGGERAEVYIEEAGCTRLEDGEGGRLVVNYGLSKGKLNTADNRVYLPYDPQATQEEIAAQVLAAHLSDAGYWGHLWYVFEAKPGRIVYPVPSYYSGKEDIETDAAIARYDLKQAVDGFFPDAWMTLVGTKYNAQPDPNFLPLLGQTMDDAPSVESEDLRAVKAALKGMKGSQTGASIGISVADNENELPKIEFFNNGPNSKNLSDMVDRITGKVCRHFGVPPVLIGVQVAGVLGSNQQIVNSIQLFGLVVNPARRVFTEALGRLFPGLDMSVAPLDPVDYIDPAILAKMTDDEVRSLRNLPALEEKFTPTQQDTIRALRAMPDSLSAAVLATLTPAELRAFLPVLVEAPTPEPATP